MILKNKYAIGCLVMFYEVEMFEDYVDGILNMIKDIENPENITIDICFSTDEYFERMASNIHDTGVNTLTYVHYRFSELNDKIKKSGININVLGKYVKYKYLKYPQHEPRSIAWYRRDFNYRYANEVDFLLWGETDSIFPASTFEVLEQVSEYASEININKYVVTFAYRKMWDDSWRVIEHPEYTDVKFEDTYEWNSTNPASEKCYMSIEEMNKLNKKYDSDGYDIITLNEPIFDGSCLVISSEMVKMGINIPHALLMSGEDTSFGWAAKKILGDNYIQFHVKNVLRVHNRRHPKKRMYIEGEKNPQGFCGEKDKGTWWKLLEEQSKENLYNLDNPKFKFNTWEDFFNKAGVYRNSVVR